MFQIVCEFRVAVRVQGVAGLATLRVQGVWVQGFNGLGWFAVFGIRDSFQKALGLPNDKRWGRKSKMTWKLCFA